MFPPEAGTAVVAGTLEREEALPPTLPDTWWDTVGSQLAREPGNKAEAAWGKGSASHRQMTNAVT